MESGEDELDAAFRRTGDSPGFALVSLALCPEFYIDFAQPVQLSQDQSHAVLATAWFPTSLIGLVDVAFAIAGELHKSNAARKDAELQELRRVVAAKEKSIDSLRTQLATAKGSLEAYTQESEAMLQQRDGEAS